MQNITAGNYMKWLKAKQPYFYDIIISKYPQAKTLQGLGLSAATGTDIAITGEKSDNAVSASWLDTIKNVISVASQAYLTKEQIDAQKKLTNMQLDRVSQGLPLLDIDPTSVGLPGPSVRFGMTSDTKTMLMYGVGGLAALFLLSQFFGGRRRA